MASSVRLKPLNCSRLPCVYAQETLTFLLTQKKTDKLVLTSVTPASSAPVLQTPKATSSTLYFDSLTVNAGNGGFLHCIQMDTSVNAANQVVSVGADIAFDADPKFFACLVRFESSSVPTTLPTAYDVYPLDGRHDGGYYTVKDC